MLRNVLTLWMFHLSFITFRKIPLGKILSILISGGQHPPYCHACLHGIPDVGFKILSVLGGQHGPCYPLSATGYAHIAGNEAKLSGLTMFAN